MADVLRAALAELPRKAKIIIAFIYGSADPYRACGPVRITSTDDITGDRPMNITWSLAVLLPPRMFSEFSVLRGQG